MGRPASGGEDGHSECQEVPHVLVAHDGVDRQRDHAHEEGVGEAETEQDDSVLRPVDDGRQERDLDPRAHGELDRLEGDDHEHHAERLARHLASDAHRRLADERRHPRVALAPRHLARDESHEHGDQHRDAHLGMRYWTAPSRNRRSPRST